MPVPTDITVRPCIDLRQEVSVLAAHLRAWRLAGVPSDETAILSTREETVAALLALTETPAGNMRVGELGRTDVTGVKALALVGCDHSFFAPSAGDFQGQEAYQPHDQARLVLRACAAPADHLLVTWRGRPESMFAPLGEAA